MFTLIELVSSPDTIIVPAPEDEVTMLMWVQVTDPEVQRGNCLIFVFLTVGPETVKSDALLIVTLA
jgi:hypothetical protein